MASENKMRWVVFLVSFGFLFVVGTMMVVSADEPVIRWYLNGTRFVLTQNGTIGVGTDSPVGTFAVNGTANITGYLLYNESEVCTSANGLCTGVASESDPVWSGNSTTVARTGTCAPGFVVQNSTVNGVQCVADQTGGGVSGGNMTVWRLDADTGSTANVTNFSLVRVLSSTGISTTISGLDIFIENTGDTNAADDYTSSNFNSDFSGKTTNDLSEGSTNKYDNRSWNQTHASTLYAPISVTGDNTSWNKSYADTLYYSVSNPSGYITTSQDKDSWSSNASSYNTTAQYNVYFYPLNSNPLGYLNTSTGGGLSTIQSPNASIVIVQNTSHANLTVNVTYLDTIFYTDSNPAGYISSYTETDPVWAGAQPSYYNTSHGKLDNTSWNQTHASTLYAPISVTGDNVSWNESYARTLFPLFSYVNSLSNWSLDRPNYVNLTRLDNSTICRSNGANCPSGTTDTVWPINNTDLVNLSGTLALNQTTLNANFVGQNEYPNLDTDTTDDYTSSNFNSDFSGKTTNDLSEGSTNKYDNRSWNQTHANTLYAPISVTGDNTSWNKSYADTLYTSFAYVNSLSNWSLDRDNYVNLTRLNNATICRSDGTNCPANSGGLSTIQSPNASIVIVQNTSHANLTVNMTWADRFYLRNTGIAAENLTSGTIPTARLSGTYSISISGDAATFGGQNPRYYLNSSGINALNLTSGTVPTARLGSGTANSGAYLRGDSTWQVFNTAVDTAIQNTTIIRNGTDLRMLRGNFTVLNTTQLFAGSVNFTTTIVGEGSNLYYTDARAALASVNTTILRNTTNHDVRELYLNSSANPVGRANATCTILYSPNGQKRLELCN